jgi:hypothetical protein
MNPRAAECVHFFIGARALFRTILAVMSASVPPPLDHGMIGNGRVLALVSPTSAVEPSTGVMPGNYPQAYTHVGQIHAAMTIYELLEARDGKVRAWA